MTLSLVERLRVFADQKASAMVADILREAADALEAAAEELKSAREALNYVQVCASDERGDLESRLEVAHEAWRERDSEATEASRFIGVKGLGDEFMAWALKERAAVDALLKSSDGD